MRLPRFRRLPFPPDLAAALRSVAHGKPTQREKRLVNRYLKRTLRLLLVLAIVPVLFPAPAQGWQSTPLTFSLDQRHVVSPIDYETWCGDCRTVDYTTGSPWAINPTQCMWDSDDSYDYRSEGNVIPAGGSVSIHECRYADSAQGTYIWLPTDVSIYSASPDLAVTERFTWDTGSKTYTITPTRSGSQWHYFGCIYAPHPDGGTMQSVAGSHDGTGIAQDITVIIANLTKQKVGKTGGQIGAGGIVTYSQGCKEYQ
jgi:hypothetical protein